MILRKLNPFMNEQEYIDNIPNANQAFIAHILQHRKGNTSTFPEECPVEIHPYVGEVELDNFEKYIIGTFPPISYVLDNEEIKRVGVTTIRKPNKGKENKPAVNYYHGNKGSMWDLLLGDEFFDFDRDNVVRREEKKQEILGYLSRSKINYSDIIYSLKRTEYNAKDANIKNVVIYDGLIKQMIENPNLNRVLFNTGSTFSKDGISISLRNVVGADKWRINVNKLKSFDLFFRRCQDLGIKVEFKIVSSETLKDLDWVELNVVNAKILKKHLKSKIMFKARLTVSASLLDNNSEIIREFLVVTPFSPAAEGYSGDNGKINENPIISNWLAENPKQSISVLLTQIYQKFVRFNEEDKIFLMNLNQ